MRVLLQNLGLQLPRPSSSGSGQQMCTIWKRRKPIPRSCRNKPRGARMRVWRRESGIGAGEEDPFLLILSPGIPGVGTGRLSLGWGWRPGWVHVLGHQPREHGVPKCAGCLLLGLAASQTAASPTSLPHIPRRLRPAPFLRFDVTSVSRPLSSIDGSRAWLLWGR